MLRRDRYARIAVRRITHVQRSVISALQSQSSDPLAEDESIRDFDTFVESQCLDAAQRTLCFKSLDAVKLVTPLHEQEELILKNPEEPEDDVLMDDTEEAFHAVQPTSKRQKGNATERLRTASLGENPKEVRAAFRSHLEPGYYVCLSVEKKIRTLHGPDRTNQNACRSFRSEIMLESLRMVVGVVLDQEMNANGTEPATTSQRRNGTTSHTRC